MEPGGIEPPSQCSQQDASTCVVAVLNLGVVPASNSLHFGPATGEPPRRIGRLHPDSASPMSGPAAVSDVERRIGSPLGCHCVLRFGSHSVCVLFTRPARPSTRIIKPSLHGRNHIGPKLSMDYSSAGWADTLCDVAARTGHVALPAAKCNENLEPVALTDSFAFCSLQAKCNAWYDKKKNARAEARALVSFR